MKAFACLVRQTPLAWIVSIGELQPLILNSEETKPTELAQAVLEYIEQAKPEYGRCHDKIVLCPDARATLFATSPIPDGLKKRDRQQLKFHAESLIPLGAEQMAADFEISDKELRVLAIDRDEWQPIVDAFATRDLHFRWIAPAPILAVEEARELIGDTSRVIIWEENDACDLFRFDGDEMAHWTHLVGHPEDRPLAIRLFATQSAGVRTWTAINCRPSTVDQIEALGGIDVRQQELEPLSAFASSAADRLCRSADEAWFDLRDGSIAGRDRYRALGGWIKIAAAAVAGLLIATSIACFWKSRQAIAQKASVDAALEKLYREAELPGETIPLDVASSIMRARRNMERERDIKGELKPIPSALDVLYAILTALNVDKPMNVRAQTFRINNGKLDSEFLFQSIQDAQLISDRLKIAGINTGDLTTKRESNGKERVSFKGSLK